MTVKLTPKQEKFAQVYIETGNASEAYRQAYSAEKMKAEVVAVKASELLKNGKVAVRVAELQAEHKDRHNVTVDGIVAELEQARQISLAREQGAAMVAATMGKAKVCGLLVDKVQDDRPPPILQIIKAGEEEPDSTSD